MRYFYYFYFMNLNFRTATVDDVPLIYQLAEKIWNEHYPDIITNEQIGFMLRTRYNPELLKEKMQDGERFYLAFDGDIPVAYASTELVEGNYFLHKFYVDVSNHRAGIGTRFFDYMLIQMDNQKPIRLQVNRQNYKAINFYFKKGFVIESIGDFDIGGGYFMNDFIMVRKP